MSIFSPEQQLKQSFDTIVKNNVKLSQAAKEALEEHKNDGTYAQSSSVVEGVSYSIAFGTTGVITGCNFRNGLFIGNGISVLDNSKAIPFVMIGHEDMSNVHITPFSQSYDGKYAIIQYGKLFGGAGLESFAINAEGTVSKLKNKHELPTALGRISELKFSDEPVTQEEVKVIIGKLEPYGMALDNAVQKITEKQLNKGAK